MNEAYEAVNPRRPKKGKANLRDRLTAQSRIDARIGGAYEKQNGE